MFSINKNLKIVKNIINTYLFLFKLLKKQKINTPYLSSDMYGNEILFFSFGDSSCNMTKKNDIYIEINDNSQEYLLNKVSNELEKKSSFEINNEYEDLIKVHVFQAFFYMLGLESELKLCPINKLNSFSQSVIHFSMQYLNKYCNK